MHASLTRQTVPWQAVIALDGVSAERLPAPLADDPRVRTLALPRPVGAACARNLALAQVDTKYTNWADDDDEFTDDAMSLRLNALESAGVGWCAGWSEDLHPDGSTTLWRCPAAPGRHEAGDVWTYWKSPADTIPIGPTTILARTELVRAAPMGGLVQGEDYCTAVGISNLAPGILLPVPVYRYRKHAGQLTAQHGYDELEAAAREHAWQYGRSLRSALRNHPPVGSTIRCATVAPDAHSMRISGPECAMDLVTSVDVEGDPLSDRGTAAGLRIPGRPHGCASSLESCISAGPSAREDAEPTPPVGSADSRVVPRDHEQRSSNSAVR